ncbi:MAG: hypothetical protein HRU06_12875 [Oceanospirillaceae bacterium]|nr:hypothetical protein [Colwellia sp.]NQZ32160.1 hypothetical protein [Oceanospirillaceae bacterium]
MVSSNNLILALLSFSLLTPTTFGIFGSYAIILMLLSFIFVFMLKGGRAHKNYYLLQGIVFICLLSLFSLSYINGGHLALVFGKALHTWVLFLFVSIKYPINIKYNNVITIFLVYSIIIFAIVYFYKPYGVMFRFTGYAFDPNYFGMTCLALYMSSYLFDKYKGLLVLKSLMIIAIFLTASATVISLLVLFHLIVVLRIRLNSIGVLLVIIGSLIVYSIFIYSIGSLLEDLNVDGSLYWRYKLASLEQRLDVQIRCFEIFFSNVNYFLYGVGSGRTNEFLGKALHNGFLQMVFAHGVGFLLVVVIYIVRIYSSLQRKALFLRDKRVVFAGFIVFIVSNYALDTFLTGSFIIFILIVKMYQHVELKN